MQWTQLHNPDSLHYDVVIFSVPYTDSDIPLMAPAVLKPIVEKAGKSCLAADLNIEIYRYVRNHPLKDKLRQFFFDEHLDPAISQEVYDIFDGLSDQILSFSPQYVGLSVFSFLCQSSTKWLSYFLKKKNPNVKIILGGAGCLPSFTGTSKFIKILKNANLFDYHIRGDAEHSLFELLTGNDEYDGINDSSWKLLTNKELEALPYPDYSSYNFQLYDVQALPLIGSRGCVRKCTFCDYIANWKKFQWRTAENIFEEMLIQSELHNIRVFKFQLKYHARILQ
jgi:radical SAM superfamily enzyme YgiQ (UPF0313 family)